MREKTIKIVVVGTFAKTSEKSYYHANKDSDDYYVDSWGALFARRLKKRYPDIDIEVWRPDDEFTEIYCRKAYGVDCIIFPFRKHLFSRTITLEMLRRLWEYNREYSLVIHLNTIFDFRFNILMPLLIPGAKFVLSHHGGVFPTGTNIRNAIKRKLIHYSYRNIHAITYLRKSVRNEIESKNRKVKLSFLPVGADFNMMMPASKQDCREKLGLNENTIYGIFIGPYSSTKNIELVISAYYQLKDKYNFSVIFVGGTDVKTQELFSEVKNTGCPDFGWVVHQDIPLYLNAADFYIHPIFNYKLVGFDVSLIEAMACNLPVCSSQLNELNFDYNELGVSLDSANDTVAKIDWMINNYRTFTRCREVAIKHLDSDSSIVDTLYNILNT